MNQQLTQLLEKLASKLGTTTEYLWGVLLKQARISAIESLLFILFVYAMAVLLIVLNKKFSKKKSNSTYAATIYSENESVEWIMIISTVIWVILFISSLFSCSNAIDGFLNPEFWALNQITNKL